MAIDFDEETYDQRWQVETVMSMLKRRLGEALNARSFQPRQRELGRLALTHNLMILRMKKLFYRATLTPTPRGPTLQLGVEQRLYAVSSPAVPIPRDTWRCTP
jgi:hypothetical protein